MEEKYWRALFVKTGEEDKVQQRINYLFARYNFKVLVPKRKLRERKNGIWREKTRILFPGYVLLDGDVAPEGITKLKEIPGVIKMLYPRIYPQEISIIERLTRVDEVIGFSDVLLENREIRVVDGPLVGLEGLIMGINPRKGRVKIRLNFLGEPKIIDLGIAVIQGI